MLKFVTLIALTILVIQGFVDAKPKAKSQEHSQLQELAANAQTVVKDVTNTLSGQLPDSKKVVETLNTNAQTLANSVQDVVDKLKSEVSNHQGDIESVLKQVSEKLAETKTNLQKALGPEGQKKANEIKTDLDKGLKEAVAQVEKLTKAIEPEANKVKEDVTNAAKTFLDQIVEVSKNLQKQLEATAKA
nr:unnamed protein product [Callosobruchus chinensis]